MELEPVLEAAVHTLKGEPGVIDIRNIDTPFAPFRLNQEMLRFADRDQISLSWPGRFRIDTHVESIGSESRAEDFLERGPPAGGILTFEQKLE